MNKEIINLVVQSFGRENEYLRAQLLITSFLNHIDSEQAHYRIHLFTDDENKFNMFRESGYLIFHKLTESKIAAFRGKIDFIHRMKIEVIKEAMISSEGYFLYADSDTFFTDNPLKYCLNVGEGVSSMHIQEYKYCDILEGNFYYSPEIKAYAKHIDSRTVELPTTGRIHLSDRMYSWNAGVMIFHESHLKWMDDVIHLTELTFPPTQCHAAEQFAFSIVFAQNTRIVDCESMSHHYWYRTHKQVTDLKLEQFVSEYGIEKLSEQVYFDKFIRQLQKDFVSHPIVLYDLSMQAFNFGRYKEGLKWSAKYLSKKPFDRAFYKDFIYHMKRQLF